VGTSVSSFATSGAVALREPTPSSVDNGWSRPRLAAAGVLLAGGLFAARGAWEDIFHVAMRDEEASHIWLVPFLVAWLIHLRRAALLRVTPSASFLGPILVAAGWALCHWGFNGARQSPFQAGAVLIAIGALVTVLGARILVTLWPAVILLAFIVPVPGMMRQKLSIPLEQLTARATVGILSVLGAPIERTGNVITINGYPVRVAEACNGLRMIFPLLMIVYVFCFTLPLKASVRALLLITSPLSCVACNVLRLIPTMLLFGYTSDEHKHFAQSFHDYSGWPMVPVAFLVLWGLIRLLSAMGFKLTTEPPARANRKEQPNEDRHVPAMKGVASC
jgi:exosortase